MEQPFTWEAFISGDTATEATPLTLRAALDRYMEEVTQEKRSNRKEINRIKQWQRHPLADCLLTALEGKHFKRHRDTRLKAGLSRDTVRLELAIISHLYTTARKEWDLKGLANPIQDIKKPSPGDGRERRFEDGEEPALMAAAESLKPLLKQIIIFALDTCMRRGEIVALCWRDVRLDNAAAPHVLLRKTKNGRPRVVPLSSRAVAMLRDLPRTEARVFPVSPDWLSHRFADARKRAGLEDLRLHDMRHEGISRLFELGTLNIVEIAQITGHRDLKILKRYTHLSAMHLAKKLG